MLREPHKAAQADPVPRDHRTGRFQILKLEERIAPKCQQNPHGKYVGNCGRK